MDTPISEIDLPDFIKKYHGASDHTIGQLLHIQQWTRADLNYTVSQLAVFLKSPTKTSFDDLQVTVYALSVYTLA